MTQAIVTQFTSVNVGDSPVVAPSQTFAVADTAPAGAVVGTVAASDDVAVTGYSLVPYPQGYGATVTGGDNQPVVEFTNLNDSGPGSLREALTAGGNRLVRPADGLTGDITLLSQLGVQSNDNITLDGECRVRTVGTRIRFQDCDNLKVFRWNTGPANDGGNGDGISIESLSGATRPLHFTVMFCDIEGPNSDAAIDIVWNYGNDMIGTVAYNKFHKHWKAFLIDADSGPPWEGGQYRVTFHNNWWLDNRDRQPLMQNAHIHMFNDLVEAYGNSTGGGAGLKSRGNGQVIAEYNMAIPRDIGSIVGYDGLTVTNARDSWANPNTGAETTGLMRLTGTQLFTSPDGLTTAQETESTTTAGIFEVPYNYQMSTVPTPADIRTNAGCSALASPTAPFEIDNTGQIVTTGPVTAGTYNVAVWAIDDAGFSDSDIVSITVSADSIPPVITPGQSFGVTDTAGTGTSIGSVAASDNIAVTGYSITAGNTGGQFAIDNNGLLTVNAGLTAGTYTLTIQAVDAQGNSDTETIQISVTGAADTTPPIITIPQTFTASTTTTIGATIGTVAATDDVGVTGFSILSGNTGNQFSISNTGVLTTNTNLLAGTYLLTVRAVDAAGNADTEQITVNVTGTDTTPPVITPAQTFTLANNAVNGRVVGTVAATDDVGVTSFTIVGGDPNGVFTIDNTGLVTVADNTTLADGTYTLTVQAGDAAGNATTETVVINVVDPATIGVTPASDCDPGPLALVTLIAPYGTRLELTTNCAPYALAPKATIRGLTPWQVNGTPIGPNVAGERVTQVRATTRLIKVPIIIRGDTETEHEEAVAALGRILNPEIGPNRIAYRRADGTEREITATYVSGADNITLVDMARERHSTAELIFRAHWPFWRQVGTTHGENTATFSNGMFAGSDQVVFNNTGDHTTWPEWTITGPAENITVANMTTGHVWRLRSNLAAGETIRINTDPRDKGIWRNDDLAWVELDPTLSELFSLHPGANILMIRALYPVDGAGGTWDCRWPIWYSTC